jgi:thiosulfate dehydrogenase
MNKLITKHAGPNRQQSISLMAAMLASAALGIIVVIGAVSMYSGQVSTAQLNTEPSIEYGRQLIRETSATMGPGHADPARRFSGSNLDCASCHLDTGTEPGTLTLLLADTKYPRFSGRDGVEGDLRDRINGCMTRSMNGTELNRDSVEMVSMEMYIKGLAQQYELMGDSKRAPDEPPAFREPNRRASISAGEEVFQERCQVCHGEDGEGLAQTGDLTEGYLFPPLWGPDSFNNGAGMTRILTAARFIKARMPLGQPDLSDDEAYDVAAYMNSHERPVRANLEVDYPDLTRKPVDSPYPPYADDFPREQHLLGPFEPIREYYRNLETN